MNKFLLSMFVVGAFALSLASYIPVSAGTITVGGLREEKGFFDVEMVAITETSKSNDLFEFHSVNIATSSIAYWKVRVFCEDFPSGTRVSIGTSTSNGCGTAQNFVNEAGNNKFSLTLSNPLNTLVGYSFALKAYDVNGKWIHTEKKAFRWK